MEYCQNCGKPIKANDQFCEFCGAKAPTKRYATATSPRDNRFIFIKNLFNGRIGRKNWFLGWILARIIFIPILLLLLAIPLYILISRVSRNMFLAIGVIDLLLVIGILALYLILAISLHVRRAHDIGQSARYLTPLLIPVANWIMLIYMLCKKGQAGSNRYGNEPEADVGFWDDIFNRRRSIYNPN